MAKKKSAPASIRQKIAAFAHRLPDIEYTGTFTEATVEQGLTLDDVIDGMLQYLSDGNFLEEIIQAEGNVAYVMNPQLANAEQYLKVDFSDGETGEVMTFISCHPHGWKSKNKRRGAQ